MFGSFVVICFGHNGVVRIRRFMNDIEIRLQEFMEYEARSCSMDFGCVTPQYVCRMWGGSVPIEEIDVAMVELRRQLFVV